MSPRALALLLAGLAVAALGSWAWPAWTRAEAVRREAELAQQQTARGARRVAARRAPVVAADSQAALSESVRRMRRQVLALIERRTLSNARLEVRAGRAPARCELHFSARGEFGVLAALAGDLAVTPGLLLSSVQLTPRGGASQIELEASGR